MSTTLGVELPAPFRVIGFDRLPSTSDEAKRLALAGAAAGTIVWAREQSAGRGRLDRQWVSPPGNLFVSIVLRPAVVPAEAAELGFVAALAVADTVAGLVGPEISVRLKWPNDVLAQGGKIAGILLEAQSAPTGLVDWVVLGIGLNIATAPEGTPYPTACLDRLTDDRISIESALTRLIEQLGHRLAQWRDVGFARIRQDWLARAQGIGAAIEVRQGSAVLAGRFDGLDPDGALRLELPNGVRRITAGDIHFQVG